MSGFVCRYRHCPRSINGFISTKERKAHEVLHIRLFRCADATCEFYARGFTTKSALQRHNQRYHTKPDDSKIPVFRPMIYQSSTTPQLSIQASRNDSSATDVDMPQAAHTYIPSMPFGTADSLKPSCREFPESSLEPFLITPEQIMTLPHLSDDERDRYARGAKECWDYIETLPPPEHHTAVIQSLASFTKKLRGDLEEYFKANLDIRDIGDSLLKLDIASLPDYHLKRGPDWHVIFNPSLLRVLDVDAEATLEHDSVVWSVDFSPDGMLLATGSKASASIFDVTTSRLVCKLPHASTPGSYDNDVRAVCFAPCGNRLVTGAHDNLIRIWDFGRHKIICTLRGHRGGVFGIDWKDEVIVSGSDDKSIRLWDPVSRNCTLKLSMRDRITCVSLSPNGRWVVAGLWNNRIRIWRWSDKGAVDISITDSAGKHMESDRVRSVAYSPNGKHVVSASSDRTIKIWRSSEPFIDSRCVRTLEGHSDQVLHTTFSPDGAWLLSASKDKGVQLWDAETGRVQFRLHGFIGCGNRICIDTRQTKLNYSN